MNDVLKMARMARDGDDAQTMVWLMLHMLNWEPIKDRIQKHALMVHIEMEAPDPCVQLAMALGIALGKIEDSDGEDEA